MRTPEFWYPDDGRATWAARLLSPLSHAYAAATRRRVARAPRHHPSLPVICVGNLTAGGAGKTPTVMAILEMLPGRIGVVTRGHGGSLAGPVHVDPTRHGAAEVGDEALLLAAFAPVWVARDRAAGVRAAEAAAQEAGGVEAIALDDGFQNPDVAKAVSLVVVDAAVGFGNGRVIPAGPLREPVQAGLARADAVIAIGAPSDTTRFADHWTHRWAGRFDVPLLSGELQVLPTGMPWADMRVLAFAGIGRPAKFFATLRAQGATILRAVPLGDHQPLTPALLLRLETEARARGAQLVTTEKDAVRLPASFRQKVLTLPVRLRLDDPEALRRVLAAAGIRVAE